MSRHPPPRTSVALHRLSQVRASAPTARSGSETISRPAFAGILVMELNGALLNPDLRGRLVKLGDFHEQLVTREPTGEAASRSLRRRQGAVLKSVTAMVEQARGSIRVR